MFRTMQIVSVSFFVLLLSVFANAQGGVATGDLHVTVKDPKGSVITDASVAVRDVARGVESPSKTPRETSSRTRQLRFLRQAKA